MDTKFLRGRGGASRKIMEIPGGGGSTVKPPWNGKSWGDGGQPENKLSVGSMDIFWNHTMVIFFPSSM